MSERIIPVLTAADSRLTTTVTILGAGYEIWHGYDGDTGTFFHSAAYSLTGDVIWIGSSPYILNSLQYKAQAGYADRLPSTTVIYGSNNAGATWTPIATDTTYDETIYPVSNSTAYSSYKFSLTGGSAVYMSFAEMVVLGTPSTTADYGFLTQLLNGVLTGLRGAAKNALAYFDGSKWAVKEGGTVGQVLGIDSSGDLNYMTLSSSGVVIATQADVLAGTDNTKMVTPLALQEKTDTTNALAIAMSIALS